MFNKQVDQITQLKNTIIELKDKAAKSKIEEEYLLKKLKTDFEVDNFEEAMELLDVLIEERKELNEKIEAGTNKVIQMMQRNNLL